MTRPKNGPIWSNTSGSTGPIFAIFTLCESALRADDGSIAFFPIYHGTLPWLPTTVAQMYSTSTDTFYPILHKIGCHGNVPRDIEKRGPGRSSAPKKLSFLVKIAKISSADLEIICLLEIIKKDKN